jgi:hypothetical protein
MLTICPAVAQLRPVVQNEAMVYTGRVSRVIQRVAVTEHSGTIEPMAVV